MANQQASVWLGNGCLEGKLSLLVEVLIFWRFSSSCHLLWPQRLKSTEVKLQSMLLFRSFIHLTWYHLQDAHMFAVLLFTRLIDYRRWKAPFIVWFCAVILCVRSFKQTSHRYLRLWFRFVDIAMQFLSMQYVSYALSLNSACCFCLPVDR